jgi:hypothetical protein
MVPAKRARRLVAFPAAERVIYDVNPLEEVICQLRFPPILKIDEATLADFQECVRNSYPFYTVSNPLLPGMVAPINIPGLIGREFSMLPGDSQS